MESISIGADIVARYLGTMSKSCNYLTLSITLFFLDEALTDDLARRQRQTMAWTAHTNSPLISSISCYRSAESLGCSLQPFGNTFGSHHFIHVHLISNHVKHLLLGVQSDPNHIIIPRIRPTTSLSKIAPTICARNCPLRRRQIKGFKLDRD